MAIFETTINKKIYKLKIIKYTNIEKPKTEETKEELNIKMDNITIEINQNKNNKIKLKQIIDKYKTDNKNCVNKIKNELMTKIDKKILNRKIIVNRINKKIEIIAQKQ